MKPVCALASYNVNLYINIEVKVDTEVQLLEGRTNAFYVDAEKTEEYKKNERYSHR